MIKNLAALALSVSAVFLFPSVLLAQAPVASREAVPDQSSSNSNALQVVLELQSLREEISTLRGTIEELEYQVSRLKKKQDENYSDLDGRIANLYSGSLPVGTAQNSTAPASSGTEASSSPSAVANADSSAKSSALYDQGFSALRQGDREGAIRAFDLLVSDYPESRETPDALYWLGETYWLANKKEESRQAFVRLLDLTPDYRKAGDAMYRLGVIYDQLGDFDKAFEYMSQVLLNGSSQSAAAQTWINEHRAEESTAPSSPAVNSIDE